MRHLGEKPPSVTAKRRPKPLPPSRRNHPMNDTAPTTRWSAVCAKPLARRAGIDTSPPEVIHAEAKARAKQPLRRAWLARHGRPDQFRDCKPRNARPQAKERALGGVRNAKSANPFATPAAQKPPRIAGAPLSSLHHPGGKKTEQGRFLLREPQSKASALYFRNEISKRGRNRSKREI